MKNKIRLLVFSALLITSFSTFSVAAKSININDSTIGLAEDMTKDEKIIKEAHRYMNETYGDSYRVQLNNNYQSVTKANKIKNLFEKDNEGNYTYPSYIGGLYIDDNNRLIVQVVRKNIPKEENIEYSKYQTILKTDERANIKYVKYSYDELDKAYDTILNNYLGKYENIKGLYIDVISNKVVVELKHYDEGSIEQFKNEILDSEMIYLTQGSDFSDIINPGEGYANGYCSYGYRAKQGNKLGIVTAGHCINNNSIPYISFIGSVIEKQDTGALDAAFIAINNGVTLTNTLNQKHPLTSVDTLSTSVGSFTVGQNIGKVGVKTGFTLGTVNAVNYSYTQNSTTYTNLAKANLNCDNGDSGGVVFEGALSFGNNGLLTLGIMKAKGTGSNAGQCLITKASKINSTFRIIRY